jgi:hypothetical protein
MVVLFFGGIGMYYFKVFQWRDLEDPHYDLTIVKKEGPELAFFRTRTVPDVVDPAKQQMDKLIKLRKETDGGTIKPDGFDQSMKEIGNRLIEIMKQGKLRQIPKQYEKEYKDVLTMIGEIYRSWRELEAAVSTDIPTEKEAHMKKSIEHTKKANRLIQLRRQFFL